MKQKNKKLTEALEKIVGSCANNPECLLLAYCSCLLEKIEGLNVELFDGYYYKELLVARNEDFRKHLLGYTLLDFMRIGCPLIADFNEFKRIIESLELKGFSAIEIMISIIQVRRLEDSKIKRSKASKDSIYSAYFREIKRLGLNGLYKQDFNKLVFSLRSFCLNSKTVVSAFKTADKDYEQTIKSCVSVLYNDLRQSRENAVKLCAELFAQKITKKSDVEKFINKQDFFESATIKYTSAGTRSIAINNENNGNKYFESLDSLCNLFWEIIKNRLCEKLACGLYLFRKTAQDKENGEVETTGDVVKPNDVLVENSILFSLFSATAYEEGRNVVALSPSPFFVRKWVSSALYEKVNMTFVFNSEAEKTLTDLWLLKNPYDTPSNRSRLERHTTLLSYEDFLKTQGEYTDAIVIENRITNIQGLDSFFATYKGRLVALASNKTWNSGSLFKLLNHNNYETIFLLPDNLPGTKPSKKNIIIWDAEKQEKSSQIALYSIERKKKYGKEESEGLENRRLFIEANPVIITGDDLSTNKSLRELYQEQKKVTVKKRNRNIQYMIYPYTAEINFLYEETEHDGKGDLYDYIVWFLVGKERKGQKKKSSGMTREAFFNWLENDYINSIIYPRRKSRSNEDEREADTYKGKQIRSWITQELAPSYVGVNITLKSFWVFHPELEKLLTKTHLGIVRDLAMSPVGQIKVGSITSEDILDYYDSFSQDSSFTAELRTVFKSVSKLVSYAIKFGNASENAFKEMEDKDFSLESVRDALAKKTLSSENFRLLSQKLEDSIIKDGNRLALGLLIKMFTGLSSAEVCALKWIDFRPIEEFPDIEAYNLNIYKSLNYNSKEPRFLAGLNAYRRVPLGRNLGMLLYNEFHKKEDSLLFYIISKNGKEPYSTTELNDEFKNFSQFLKNIDITILSPTKNGEKEENYLTDYRGDLLRRNYEFWSKGKAGISNEELKHMLGLIHGKTFALNYLCHTNNQTLLSLWQKQNRLEAYVKYYEADDLGWEVKGQEKTTIHKNTYSPLTIEISCEAITDELTLTVKSNFGSTVKELKIMRGEDSNGK